MQDLTAVGSLFLERFFKKREFKDRVQQKTQGKQQWDGFRALLFISRLPSVGITEIEDRSLLLSSTSAYSQPTS